jgi:ribonuclease J
MTHNAKKGMYFLPIGGADEIGMNMYAYGCDGKWIVVDAGYGFLNDDYPGMDMCYASPAFLESFQEDIEGLFITHGHEDHMGAVAQIWPSLKCPIYATTFAMGLIYARLKEYHLEKEPELINVAPGEVIHTSAFAVEFVPLAHSVPQTCGLYIKTPHASVFHATDWRFDDGRMPMLQTAFKRLEEIGREGVSMFVADSTNIRVDHQQPSEMYIRESLFGLVPQIQGGLLATCFASNLMRLESLVWAAYKAGRTPVLVGKSLVNNYRIAKSCGYFENMPQVFLPDAVQGISSDKALYICTGSQANYRSALTTIVKDESRYIKLCADDTVIFSSKIIPGNEEKIEQMQEKMREKGVRVITDAMQLVHTSGHCSKEEIKKMYELLKPSIVFPVHGDRSFVTEHCEFALQNGIKEACCAQNGDLFWLENDHIEKIEEVASDTMGVDRGRCISLSSEVVRRRKQIAYNCSLFISLVVTADNQVADLQISSADILDSADWKILVERYHDELVEMCRQKLNEAGGLTTSAQELIRGKIRRLVFKETGTKPLTIMHVYQIPQISQGE